MSKSIARGDVFWVTLDPVQGSEMARTRPCVVVSLTELNAVRRTVVIVPLTSTTTPANWPLLIELPTFTPQTRARIEQIRVVDKSRLRSRIHALDNDALASIEAAMALVLGIRH